MNSLEIQESVYQFLKEHEHYYNAPYGVLTSAHTNTNGRPYKSVTFGCARSLDAEVRIFNRNFILLRTSSNGSEVFKNIDDLLSRLNPNNK
jgi:hypothetical protein